MQVQQLHPWQVSPAEAQAIQRRLAGLVSRSNELALPKFVAGVDISAPSSRGMAVGAVVVLSFPDLAVVEAKVTEQRVDFPYVPGLLSFREAPLVLAACERLTTVPDLVLVDGQGIAHPRRFGLASHLGLLLDTPTVGCAKSILCGTHETVEEAPGSFAEIRDNGEVIGAALRTRAGVKPVYISIGHKVDLSSALSWAMKCCRGYRLPEPTRLAHLAASGRLPNK
ncbi:MAG: deoxyribonuclease V [Dehalococcoidia bacterium]|nr:deoxyribonuclease V [Dehalococcoidia bacterium]